MPATPIPITTQSFQGGMDLTADLTVATEEMTFINDGYTVLYIINSDDDTSTDVTITAVKDNAGRVKNLTQTIEFSDNALLGPFRPIWWNSAGVVQVTFTEIESVFVKAIKLQF